LFSDSAGYCQRPGCANRLFVDTGTKNIHIAEIAHIIAASETGPRSDATVTQADKSSYENLVLLCANCHTTIDKSPHDFPDNIIRDWKRKHVERINSLFGAVEYADRVSARKAIEPALTENRSVLDERETSRLCREDSQSLTAPGVA
jgi:hypothetical protein